MCTAQFRSRRHRPNSSDHVKRHISAVHGGSRKFECDICQKCFKEGYNLKRHIVLIHNEGGSSKLECKFCEKTFKQNHNLKRHIDITHIGSKSHQCDQCAKHFGQKSNLKKHLTRAHSKQTL